MKVEKNISVFTYRNRKLKLPIKIFFIFSKLFRIKEVYSHFFSDLFMNIFGDSCNNKPSMGLYVTYGMIKFMTKFMPPPPPLYLQI